MFSSNLTKFFAFSALIFLLFAGCRFWQKTDGADSSEPPKIADELKSEVPFTTREPENFQAEIVVTAADASRRTLIARSGAARRLDFNFGTENHFASLQTDQNFLLLPGKKIYRENSAAVAAGAATAAPDEWADFLTTRWLSAKSEASFEKLETTENVTKYRVNLGDGAANEILVYIDEQIGLPVRQEFFAVAGKEKTLTYLYELKNFKPEADDGLFIVPADYKKVSAEEFSKNLGGVK